MRLYLLPALLCLLIPSLASGQAAGNNKVVCYYDSRAYHRPESGRFLTADLEHALGHCTHVVYGYAKIDDDDFKIKALDSDLEKDSGKGNYKAVTSLKKRFPGLHVLLSVGGWADVEDKEKYLTLLRDAQNRANFVSSSRAHLQKYGFDGLDLAWQFPLIRVKQRTTLSSIWHKVKKTFGLSKGSVDELADQHRTGFTSLIKELKLAMRPDGYLLTATVIPHINYTIYYEPKEISPYLDGINIFAFDYLTAEKKITPEVADYPSPLYSSYDRTPDFNVDSTVNWFIRQQAPANKLILGIPTYGRTWQMNDDSGATGVPPLQAEGPGAEGYQTNIKGMLSYPEICTMLPNANNHGTKGLLRKVTDPSKKLGTYAYRLPDSDREGLWVGYEDPETVSTKAAYGRSKGLGGVALVDVTMDDFRGVCTGDRYPLLKAAKQAI